MEGYKCQKSTLCNKRSNKKECGILQALALSIQRKANRTLVYQSRLSTPRWLSAEIFNTRVSQHRDSLHGCGCDWNARRSRARDSRL